MLSYGCNAVPLYTCENNKIADRVYLLKYQYI